LAAINFRLNVRTRCGGKGQNVLAKVKLQTLSTRLLTDPKMKRKIRSALVFFCGAAAGSGSLEKRMKNYLIAKFTTAKKKRKTARTSFHYSKMKKKKL